MSRAQSDADAGEAGEEIHHLGVRHRVVHSVGDERHVLAAYVPTAERTLPYFNAEILPRVLKGENVLVAAHGNSLRSIIMDLEKLSGDEIVARELNTGEPIVYELNEDGSIKSKKVLAA